MGLDEVDQRIVRMLQADARTSYRAIAERVGIRAPSVHARVKRLEEAGVIRGYHADVDPAKVGRSMTAYVAIGIGHGGDAPPRATKGPGGPSRTEAITSVLKAHPEVVEVHAITGEDDLLVKLRVSDIEGLERVLIRVLEPLEGVRRTTTMLVVRSMFERTTPV